MRRVAIAGLGAVLGGMVMYDAPTVAIQELGAGIIAVTSIIALLWPKALRD